MRPLVLTDPAMGENCYLLRDKDQVLAIDPGFNGEALLALLAEKGWTLSAVLLTHGHYDHVRDLRLLAKTLVFPLYIHADDRAFLDDDRKNGAGFFGGSFRLRADQEVRLLADGTELPFFHRTIRVLHTPGHTPGSVCFLDGSDLYSGDTLFAGDLGRTDLEGGSSRQLAASVLKLFSSLPDAVRVHPGHEAETTIGTERTANRDVVRILKSH